MCILLVGNYLEYYSNSTFGDLADNLKLFFGEKIYTVGTINCSGLNLVLKMNFQFLYFNHNRLQVRVNDKNLQ